MLPPALLALAALSAAPSVGVAERADDATQAAASHSTRVEAGVARYGDRDAAPAEADVANLRTCIVLDQVLHDGKDD